MRETGRDGYQPPVDTQRVSSFESIRGLRVRTIVYFLLFHLNNHCNMSGNYAKPKMHQMYTRDLATNIVFMELPDLVTAHSLCLYFLLFIFFCHCDNHFKVYVFRS